MTPSPAESTTSAGDSASKPRRRHDPERRDRIVEACIGVIAEVGVAGTSHRVVAAAAGVPLGSMTYHFDGIDDLVHEALDRFAHRVSDRFEARMRAVTTREEAIAAVEQIVQVDALPDRHDLVLTQELYGVAARDERFRDITDRWMSRSRAAFERHFDPVTARMLDALTEGLTLHRTLGSGALPLADTREAIRRITDTSSTPPTTSGAPR